MYASGDTGLLHAACEALTPPPARGGSMLVPLLLAASLAAPLAVPLADGTPFELPLAAGSLALLGWDWAR